MNELFFLISHIFLLFFHGQEEYIIKGNAQGTTYLISYHHHSSQVTKDQIDSIFDVVDRSLSLYKTNSLISIFNRDGKVLMDPHMKNVVKKADGVSRISEGAFDITVKPLVDYWGKQGLSKPDKHKIGSILKSVGYRNIIISGDSLQSKRKNVQIDCNGIAQGYTVDVLYEFLISKGIHDFLIEVGGELRCSGMKLNGESWKIGIESPSQRNYVFEDNKIIQLNGRAVTTAGNYRKYIESNGKKTVHIIDPLTGYPARNGIISVTVIADDAITADAWDDVFFVKGLDWTKEWLKKNEFLEVLIIYLDSRSEIREFSSKKFSEYLVGGT